MSLHGKGFFIQSLAECEGGNPQAILGTAQAADLRHVIVKVADGSEPLGLDLSRGDLWASVVQLLRSNGIAVWGWHPVYGDDPDGEVQAAIRRASGLSLDGYVIQAGEKYERSGMASAAERFMHDVRLALDIPLALSSYRFPNYHPGFPWAAFLEKCDFHMPQVFWEGGHNATWQLRESKRQCDALPNTRPYIATGPAYCAGSWSPVESEVVDFLDAARELRIAAVNFFEWAACRKNLPLLWKIIAEYAWPEPPQMASPVG
jgi:hypothetical protein